MKKEMREKETRVIDIWKSSDPDSQDYIGAFQPPEVTWYPGLLVADLDGWTLYFKDAKTMFEFFKIIQEKRLVNNAVILEMFKALASGKGLFFSRSIVNIWKEQLEEKQKINPNEKPDKTEAYLVRLMSIAINAATSEIASKRVSKE